MMLEGKVAIVTGSTQGLGLDIARGHKTGNYLDQRDSRLALY